MKNHIKKLGVFLIVISALALTSCGNSETEEQSKSEVKVKRVSVEAQKVNPELFTDYIKAVGVVKPFAKANITANEMGIIRKIEKDKGSYVKKGDVLFITDNDLLKANMDAAKAQYELAEMTFQKNEEIYKQNVNSEYQYLQAKYARNQAKAAYDAAKERYEMTFVKSPIDGFVDTKNFEEGEFAAVGPTIMTVINNSKVKIIVGVPERYVEDLKVGKNAIVSVPELKNREFRGKVSFVSTSVSVSNRTFDVEIIIDNPEGIIKPEMVAEVKIERKKYDNVYIIPDDALIRTDNDFVLFVAEDGKAVKRVVEIITRFEDKIAIAKGLNPGEMLITVGQQNILDGTAVQIVN